MPATESTQGTAREELRRIAADTRWRCAWPRGKAELPEPTPADGPDPYGNPDPDWLGIDWSRAPPRGRRRRGPRQLRRDGRGPADRLRPRALGRLAELARADPVLRALAPSGRCRPARLRRQPDAAVGDLDPRLRHLPARLLRAAGGGALRLVGNSMGGFIATEVAIAEPERVEPARAGLGRRHHLGAGPSRARGDDRPRGPGRGPAGAAIPDVGHQAPRDPAARLRGRLPRPRAGCGASCCGRTSYRHSRAPATTTR